MRELMDAKHGCRARTMRTSLLVTHPPHTCVASSSASAQASAAFQHVYASALSPSSSRADGPVDARDEGGTVWATEPGGEKGPGSSKEVRG